MIAGEVGRDREEPRPDVGLWAERAVGAIRSQEGLLGEVLGLRRAGGYPPEIAVDLPMVRPHDGLEWLCAHHQ